MAEIGGGECLEEAYEILVLTPPTQIQQIRTNRGRLPQNGRQLGSLGIFQKRRASTAKWTTSTRSGFQPVPALRSHLACEIATTLVYHGLRAPGIVSAATGPDRFGRVGKSFMVHVIDGRHLQHSGLHACEVGGVEHTAWTRRYSPVPDRRVNAFHYGGYCPIQPPTQAGFSLECNCAASVQLAARAALKPAAARGLPPERIRHSGQSRTTR